MSLFWWYIVLAVALLLYVVSLMFIGKIGWRHNSSFWIWIVASAMLIIGGFYIGIHHLNQREKAAESPMRDSGGVK